MAANAHMTSPYMRRTVLTSLHSVGDGDAVLDSPGAVALEACSTPPPVQTTAWLDPNLPTPPTYALGQSSRGSRGRALEQERKGVVDDEGADGEGAGEADRELQADARRVEDMLTRGDILGDPILSRLAQKQSLCGATPLGAAAAAEAPARAGTGANTGTKARVGGAEGTRPGEGAEQAYVFKAKPAPATTTKAAGPRLSKAAALRMGVYEPTERERERAEREKRKEEEEAEKARKRIARQSLNIASLAPPTLAPKQNRTAQLRSGVPAETLTALNPSRRLKTAEEVEADKQQRLKEEKEKRRESVTLPASYSVPSITPRMNRTTALRNGTALPPIATHRGALQPSTAQNARERETKAARDAKAMPPPSLVRPRPTTSAGIPASVRKTAVGGGVGSASSSRPSTAIGSADRPGTAGKVRDTGSAEREGTKGGETGDGGAEQRGIRRSSTVAGVRSLGAPSIVPRLNKTAMLRTAPRPSTSTGHAPAPPSASASSASRPSVADRRPGAPTGTSGASTAQNRSRASSAAAVTGMSASHQASSRGTAAAISATSTSRKSGQVKGLPVVKQTKASLLRAAAVAKEKQDLKARQLVCAGEIRKKLYAGRG